MVYQGATGLYHFLINVIPFISNSVGFIYTIANIIIINVNLALMHVFQDFSKVPNWLEVSRSLVPDLIVKDPKVNTIIITSNNYHFMLY